MGYFGEVMTKGERDEYYRRRTEEIKKETDEINAETDRIEATTAKIEAENQRMNAMCLPGDKRSKIDTIIHLLEKINYNTMPTAGEVMRQHLQAQQGQHVHSQTFTRYVNVYRRHTDGQAIIGEHLYLTPSEARAAGEGHGALNYSQKYGTRYYWVTSHPITVDGV